MLKKNLEKESHKNEANIPCFIFILFFIINGKTIKIYDFIMTKYRAKYAFGVIFLLQHFNHSY